MMTLIVYQSVSISFSIKRSILVEFAVRLSKEPLRLSKEVLEFSLSMNSFIENRVGVLYPCHSKLLKHGI